MAHHHRTDKASVTCAVLTVSDTRTEGNDYSGREVRRLLEEAGHVVGHSCIVPDDPERVRELVAGLASGGQVEAVLLSGGTGIAPRDKTFEAVSGLLTRRIDGFGELFRMLSFEEIGAAAMLSRAVAGLVGGVAVFSMPGSTPACRLAMERLILPQLGHLAGLVAGDQGNRRQ